METAVTSRALRILQTTMARKESQNAEPFPARGGGAEEGVRGAGEEDMTGAGEHGEDVVDELAWE